MKLIESTIPCLQCGADVPLRSFRPRSTMICPVCGRRRDPDAFRATLGTFLFAPLLLLAEIAACWGGYRAGELLAPQLNIKDLPAATAGFCAINVLWLIVVLYHRWVGGRFRAEMHHLDLLKLPLIAGAVTGLAIHGISAWPLAWAAVNGLIAYGVLQLLLPVPTGPNADSKNRP